jgi:hypothetical protein
MSVELSATSITCIVNSCMVNGDAINLPRVKMVSLCMPVHHTLVWWSEQKNLLSLLIATILPEILIVRIPIHVKCSLP